MPIRKMTQSEFKACMDYHLNQTSGVTWVILNNNLGTPYPSGEALRSAFKRERKNRGLIPQFQNTVTKTEPDFPRIVCFDIELSPMVVYTFDLYPNSISPDNIVKDKHVLSWSGKVLNDSRVWSDVVSPEEVLNGSDERVVRSMWEFLNGAKIIIGHNVKDFDLRIANTRFLMYGLPPISAYQVIDTLKIARTTFEFSSNSLKHINRTLGIRQKIENSGMRLWIDCMNGNAQSLNELDEYCQGDVLAVEELYYKFRPFVAGHPNLGLFFSDTETRCPNCGSNDTISNGYYFTTSGKYESVRCSNCGAISRRRKDIMDKEKKKNVLRN